MSISCVHFHNQNYFGLKKIKMCNFFHMAFLCNDFTTCKNVEQKECCIYFLSVFNLAAFILSTHANSYPCIVVKYRLFQIFFLIFIFHDYRNKTCLDDKNTTELWYNLVHTRINIVIFSNTWYFVTITVNQLRSWNTNLICM